MVLVIPCDNQFPASFSIIEVKSTCLCFIWICTQAIPFRVLAHIRYNNNNNNIFKVQYPIYISIRVQWTVHNMAV